MFIYFFLLRIVSLFNPKARKLVKGQARTIEQLSQLRRPGERWVWFHAASVGEFEQGRMLIERLRQQQPEVKILLTFFSPSGYELRKDYPLVDMVAYLPFATPLRAKRFLNILQPEKAIFIKTMIFMRREEF
jgi:3-deoxy-D-manno-octulosonic-acid transferase